MTNDSSQRDEFYLTRPGITDHRLLITAFLFCAGAAAFAAPQPPLSPSDALASFQLEPGLRVELVAAEPLVVDPVAMAFDEHGRLFVVENRDYPTGPKSGDSPAGAIALLQDKDGDGAFETRSDFVQGLTFPNGVMPWNGGVFVTCAPDLLYFKDTDGDGKVDVRKVVLTGFSTNSTTQLRVSHPTMAPDGWIYLTSGLGTGGKVRAPGQTNVVEFKTDSRFNPLTEKFEPIEARAQYGLTFDDAGRRFICMNRVHVQHVVIPSRYLKRNAHITISDAVQNCPEEMTPEPLKGHGAAARIYPIAEHVTTADSHEGTFTAACGVFVYEGDALPRRYGGNVFACEPTANLVHRDELQPNGSTFVARRAVPEREFLASTDTWFRPVFLTSGPDGALYVCDMYRKTIEHPEYLPQEVRKGTDFESGKGMGRIYRVVADEVMLPTAQKLGNLSTKALCQEVNSPNSWNRATAHRLLLERYATNQNAPAEAVALLEGALEYGRRGQLHRLFLLEFFGALRDHHISSALYSRHPKIRENALIFAEPRLRRSKAILERVMELADDSDPRVRMQCALTLGELNDDKMIALLADIAVRDAHDAWTRLAIVSSSTGREPELLSKLLAKLEARTLSGTNDGGLLMLCHELGRIAGLTATNRTSWKGTSWKVMGEVASTISVEEPWRISALSGIGEGLRGQVSDFRTTSIYSHFSSHLQKQMSGLRAICTNSRLDVVLRQHATSLLAFGSYRDIRDSLLGLLRPTESSTLQLAAVRALARSSNDELVSDLIAPERWQLYTPVVRDAVLNALLSDTKHLPGALSALESGNMSKSTVDSTRRKQLLNHKDQVVRSRAEALFKNSNASDRMKAYDDWKSVIGLKPAPRNGRTIFKQHCGPCHRLDREGVNVGPDLFGIRNQPKEAILLHIIVPEHEIAPGFTAYEVETKDGRTVTGLIVADTPAAVTIRGGQGQEDTIARFNIASISSHGLSLMPQEMEKNMSRQDMADLLAFLKGEQDR